MSKRNNERNYRGVEGVVEKCYWKMVVANAPTPDMVSIQEDTCRAFLSGMETNQSQAVYRK